MSWLLIIDIVLCKDQMENLQIIDKSGYKTIQFKGIKNKSWSTQTLVKGDNPFLKNNQLDKKRCIEKCSAVFGYLHVLLYFSAIIT